MHRGAAFCQPALCHGPLLCWDRSSWLGHPGHPQGDTLPVPEAVEKHCQAVSSQSHSACAARMENAHRTSLAEMDGAKKHHHNANWGLHRGPAAHGCHPCSGNTTSTLFLQGMNLQLSTYQSRQPRAASCLMLSLRAGRGCGMPGPTDSC